MKQKREKNPSSYLQCLTALMINPQLLYAEKNDE